MKQAPVYVRCFDLAAWVCRQVSPNTPTGARLHRDVNDLLDHVVLGLKGFERPYNVERADACNALLRVRCQLAHELDLISARQLLFLAGELDAIGRQLGGWLKSLNQPPLPCGRGADGAVTGEARHR